MITREYRPTPREIPAAETAAICLRRLSQALAAHIHAQQPRYREMMQKRDGDFFYDDIYLDDITRLVEDDGTTEQIVQQLDRGGSQLASTSELQCAQYLSQELTNQTVPSLFPIFVKEVSFQRCEDPDADPARRSRTAIRVYVSFSRP